jgi:type III secretory pathway component EscU
MQDAIVRTTNECLEMIEQANLRRAQIREAYAGPHIPLHNLEEVAAADLQMQITRLAKFVSFPNK